MPTRLINVDEIVKSDGTLWSSGPDPKGTVCVEGQCWGANHQPFTWAADLATALKHYDPDDKYLSKLLEADKHTITWEWERNSGEIHQLEIKNLGVKHANINTGTNDIYAFDKASWVANGTEMTILEDPDDKLKYIWWSTSINAPFPNDTDNLEYSVSSGSGASGGTDNYEYNRSDVLRLRSDRAYNWGWGGFYYRGLTTAHNGSSFSDWCSSGKGYNSRYWARGSSFAGHWLSAYCYNGGTANYYAQHHTGNTEWKNFKIYVK